MQAPVADAGADRVARLNRALDELDATLADVAVLADADGGLRGLAVRPLVPRLERTVMLVRRVDRALPPVAERVWRLVSATVRQRQVPDSQA